MSSSSVSAPVREISVAHSPDSDDAFMFYGLATNKVRVPGLKFSHTLTDIETLNRKAMEGFYDVSAISFHAYPYIQEKYALMNCGGSVGDKYGPMVVATRSFGLEELKRMKIAVPGTLTTAYLALKLFAPKIETVVVPFDQIFQAVRSNKADVGLIIHEGQLTYRNEGLQLCEDLGVWWGRENEGLPLPLGANVINKRFEPAARKSISDILTASIQYSLAHRAEAVQHDRLGHRHDAGVNHPLTRCLHLQRRARGRGRGRL